MEPLGSLMAGSMTRSRAVAFSALPEAPVVLPTRREETVIRLRATAAARLRHLADSVAPAAPVSVEGQPA